jgi:hypothetical protein
VEVTLYLKGVNDVVKESIFQRRFIQELHKRYPGCWVEKADPAYRQGTPDLRFYHGRFWAAFEMKRSKNETHQPNQDAYISRLDSMSFARFVYPENMEEVLEDLDYAIRYFKGVERK